MSSEKRAADELLATMVVHGEMLRELWVHVLSDDPIDPLDTTDAARSLALNGMEEAFDHSDDPATESLRQTAITKMEEMWADITAGVQEMVGPTNLRTTDYGDRLADQAKQRHGSPPPDDTPDQ